MISTVTTTTTTVTTTQVMAYGIIAVIALIVFLALKEILSAEADKSERMKSFVKGSNVAIVPLLLVFVAIVAYKVVTVL
ncbi:MULTISPECIES: hypothetical protein [Methanobacterium]|jgi:uncharacterized membrane protein YwzB|uniref:Uncharacterized protein n=1 Tax=Methanobacterium veterum TaxID=408577 RepID=A0A9E4ZUF4_9EURY|nr:MULTISPECIES: hypothetical protein [Methanobacterium]MCZ3364278.1 hypothetical protein [Methanobacterium veterum]MCZ3372025.1 hypothetical protein [Methanobacterium veterum]